MLYIYLDKSGDLGFDFANKKPSNFFTICVLVLRGQRNDRAIANAVKALGTIPEVKGAALPLDTQKCFYKDVKGIKFGLYAVTLDKRKVYAGLSGKKDRIYNYIAGLAFKGVDFKDTAVRVTMTADIRGPGRGTIQLDENILDQIKGRVDILIPLNIVRRSSQESFGLQAAGIFAQGFQRKHERGDLEWHSVFKRKIRSERIY